MMRNSSASREAATASIFFTATLIGWSDDSSAATMSSTLKFLARYCKIPELLQTTSRSACSLQSFEVAERSIVLILLSAPITTAVGVHTATTDVARAGLESSNSAAIVSETDRISPPSRKLASKGRRAPPYAASLSPGSGVRRPVDADIARVSRAVAAKSRGGEGA